MSELVSEYTGWVGNELRNRRNLDALKMLRKIAKLYCNVDAMRFTQKREENTERPGKCFAILPLQSTKDHMQAIRTIDIGRHKQRLMYPCI